MKTVFFVLLTLLVTLITACSMDEQTEVTLCFDIYFGGTRINGNQATVVLSATRTESIQATVLGEVEDVYNYQLAPETMLCQPLIVVAIKDNDGLELGRFITHSPIIGFPCATVLKIPQITIVRECTDPREDVQNE